MTPMTRQEIFLSNAAGNAEIVLPNPITREEIYLQELCERLKNVGSPSSEDIQAAVNAYLDEHGINQLEAATMQEFLEAINS